MQPIVWCIAGVDPCGYAGMTLDLQTLQQLGVRGCELITAITVQTNETLSDIHYVPAQYIAAQMTALTEALPAKAIKIGMLGDQQIIAMIKTYFLHFQGKIILDPLLWTSSGKALFKGSVDDYAGQLRSLFPFVDLLTPNVIETEILLNRKIKSYQEIEQAALQYLSLGVKNVLIKGGHFSDDVFSQDYWTNGRHSCWLASPRLLQRKFRGTGCMLASAITACLALDYEMLDALVIAKMLLNRGMRLADSSLLKTGAWPNSQVDLPYLSSFPLTKIPSAFPSCGTSFLGLYPIVDSSDWIKRLLASGVRTIQLRIKEEINLENEIRKSIQLARDYQARLFINDHWQLALKHAAYGIHLGQEDLQQADIESIHQAGIRLGISTHCYHEMAAAHAYHPSYIACGPVYHTTSKPMSFKPLGTVKLKQWCQMLKPYPVVAIGGINQQNIKEVLASGVNAVALISAITQANYPEDETQSLLAIMQENRNDNH